MLLSKRNRSGIIWLILLVLIIAVLPRIISNLGKRNISELSYEELDTIEKTIEDKKNEEVENSSWNKSEVVYRRAPSIFDPNDYKLEDWMNLGLSQKQAEVVVKFASRTLYSNDDLKRIYVLPDELFDLIKDSTQYPKQISVERKQLQTFDKKDVLVDINTGSEEQLVEIPGIGPYFAKKIVEHRNALGGYVGREQLLEIWKFDEIKLAEIESFIFISPTEITRIDINLATFEQLKGHPYIDYSVANSIVKMREQDRFNSISDIKRSKLIDEELFNKLTPYIKVK